MKNNSFVLFRWLLSDKFAHRQALLLSLEVICQYNPKRLSQVGELDQLLQ